VSGMYIINILIINFRSNYDYDIAILTTTENIVFSDRVGPVCLPFKFASSDMTGSRLTALGKVLKSININFTIDIVGKRL
jgi:hypothetical protein